MKNIKNTKNNNFIKRLFIKLCRLLGFEIIDQSNFTVPTLNKNLNENLSLPGKKSITVPLGEVKIRKKIASLKVILRTCTSELIMDQNKKRLFNEEKSEYTFRSLFSLLKSIEFARKFFTNTNIEIIVTDTNSPKKDIEKIKNILSRFKIKNKLVEINLNNFREVITKGYSDAKFANMANFYTSLLTVKNEDADLFYFVEDDYIHDNEAIVEMLFSYEKFYTLFNKDLVLIPADYPYLYTKDSDTKLYLGEKKHWRTVKESLVTFMTSKKLVLENFNKLESMGLKWVDPWEKPLHEIYENYPCLSPIPSLAIHCANINSVFGLSPNIDWKRIWDENKV
tara:strand:- start:11 stop:1024 length:1014 start_codon:yes stop_codon:yes gene_type:complete